MRRLTIITVVLLSIIALNTSAKNFGYIVSVDDKKSVNSRYFKTQCTETLQESILLNTGLELDIEKVFTGDNLFFEYRTNGLIYYVEKKIVVRKKNGKLVYRKITRKERKELAS